MSGKIPHNASIRDFRPGDHQVLQTFLVFEKVVSHVLIMFFRNSSPNYIRFKIVVEKYFDIA